MAGLLGKCLIACHGELVHNRKGNKGVLILLKLSAPSSGSRCHHNHSMAQPFLTVRIK